MCPQVDVITEYDDFIRRTKQIRIAPHRRYAETGYSREREYPCKKRNRGGSGLRLLHNNDTPQMGPKKEGASPEWVTNHNH